MIDQYIPDYDLNRAIVGFILGDINRFKINKDTARNMIPSGWWSVTENRLIDIPKAQQDADFVLQTYGFYMGYQFEISNGIHTSYLAHNRIMPNRYFGTALDISRTYLPPRDSYFWGTGKCGLEALMRAVLCAITQEGGTKNLHP